jgi:hypothetical protein
VKPMTRRTTAFRAAVAVLLALAASAIVAPGSVEAQWDRACQVRYTSPGSTLWVTDNASLDGLAAMRCDDLAVIQFYNVRDPDPAVAERPLNLQVIVVTYLVQAPDVVCAARLDGVAIQGVGAGIGAKWMNRSISGCGATVTLPNLFLYSCTIGPQGHRCGSVLRP